MFNRLTRREGLLLLTHFAIEISYPKEEIILMGKFAKLMTGEVNDISYDDVVELGLDNRFVKNHLRQGTVSRCSQVMMVVDNVTIRTHVSNSPNYVVGFNQYKLSV